MEYLNASAQELEREYESLKQQYEDVKGKGLSLNMARGKPGKAQLDLSLDMLDVVNSSTDFVGADGMDCRNYGILKGIDECRKLFGEVFGVDSENVMIGGSSSLNMMFDAISCMMTKPIAEGCKPWYEVPDRKFLCPVPGYDRHFGITQYYGFEMIPVPMDENGPDMDMIEKLVSEDDSIKGVWCVPKYANPTGITYSDETVRRFAALKPAAKDFRIMWDNAYCIHDISDAPDELLNIYDECVKTGNEDLPLMFCSTSKITFPGAGVAAMAASPNNMRVFTERYNYQIISYDKINMLRHVKYFGSYEGLLEHMQKHKEYAGGTDQAHRHGGVDKAQRRLFCQRRRARGHGKESGRSLQGGRTGAHRRRRHLSAGQGSQGQQHPHRAFLPAERRAAGSDGRILQKLLQG